MSRIHRQDGDNQSRLVSGCIDKSVLDRTLAIEPRRSGLIINLHTKLTTRINKGLRRLEALRLIKSHLLLENDQLPL